MATMLAPDQITAPVPHSFAVDLTAPGVRLTARRIGNRLLNLLRRRAAFNEMMSLTPEIREDIGLTAAKMAERLHAVLCPQEEPLPGLARSLSLLWQGLVIYRDLESRRCWELALEMSPGEAARVRRSPDARFHR